MEIAAMLLGGVAVAAIRANIPDICKNCNEALNEDDKSCGNITHNYEKKIHKKCPLRFKRHHDFDKNGIIYWLGTNKGKSNTFKNPVLRGHAAVASSSIKSDSKHPNCILGRDTVRCVTKDNHYQWFLIDLRNILVSPTHYSLKHYSSHNNEALRTWKFEGYRKGNWYVLKNHDKDNNLAGKGSTITWKIGPFTKGYSMFRIRQFGVNSNDHHYLALSGFEIYGTVRLAYNFIGQHDEKHSSVDTQKLLSVMLTKNTELNEEVTQLKSKLFSKEVNKNNDDEQEKLIKDLFAQNSELQQQVNESKIIVDSQNNELNRLKTSNDENGLVEDLIRQNRELQNKLHLNEQITEIAKQQFNAVNNGVLKKNEEIKKLQTNYWKLQVDKDKDIKRLQSELEQTKTLMRAVQLNMLQVGSQNGDEKKEDYNGDKCKIKFANWLRETVGLGQYLRLFNDKQSDDVRCIKYFDIGSIQNQIGIRNTIHCQLLLEKVSEFKLAQKQFCRDMFEQHQHLKQYKDILEGNGILRMIDFRKDIKNKQQLLRILNDNSNEMANLIWTIVYPKPQQFRQIQNVVMDNEGHVTDYH
eukprot:357537_1